MTNNAQQLITIDQMPNKVGQLAPAMFQTFLLPEDQRKVALDVAYLQTVARSNPDLQVTDFMSFVQLAQLTGADPRRKQIILTTRNKKLTRWVDGPVGHNGQPQRQKFEEWVVEGVAIFSYHYFLAKARETGELMDGPNVKFGMAPYFNPATGNYLERCLFAEATAKRKSQSMNFIAWWPEFVQTNQDGNPNHTWSKMPYVMLGKCAIANVLRLLFSEALAGMYVSEEMTGEPSPIPTDMSNVRQSKPVFAGETKAEEFEEVPEEQPGVLPKPEPTEAPVHDPKPMEVQAEAPAPKPEPAPSPPVAEAAVPLHTVPTPSAGDRPALREVKSTPPNPFQESGAGMASKRTKQVLWSTIMQVAAQSNGAFNPNAAAAKLEKLKLTEQYAQYLISELNQGRYQFFVDQQS